MRVIEIVKINIHGGAMLERVDEKQNQARSITESGIDCAANIGGKNFTLWHMPYDVLPDVSKSLHGCLYETRRRTA